jgi:hypothetical protein
MCVGSFAVTMKFNPVASSCSGRRLNVFLQLPTNPLTSEFLLNAQVVDPSKWTLDGKLWNKMQRQNGNDPPILISDDQFLVGIVGQFPDSALEKRFRSGIAELV